MTYTEQELIDKITRCNQRYWEAGEPEIDDTEYDCLMRELAVINPEHPLLKAVHAPAVMSSGKVLLSRPMLSLDKAYTLEEVLKWADKYKRSEDELMLVQPKYDGISAVYENGVLSTRGDGFTGENISDKIPLIRLEAPDYIGPLSRTARGEIVIRADEFNTKWREKIIKKDGKPYRNPRNAIAGILGLENITVMRYAMERCGAFLSMIDYNVHSWTVPLCDFQNRWENLRGIIEALPYPMDGIVIKFADSEYADSLGVTAHHPRGQMAFKFTNMRRTSKLLGVEWQFGKNCLTPVAKIEPVEIGGTTIKSATLHNVQNVIDRDIQAGDRVTVERAGDVIPVIVESLPGENRQSVLISNCPACHTELARRGPELFCPNPNCPGTLPPKLMAAVRIAGIENLGKATLNDMIGLLNVRSLKDILALSSSDLRSLPGFAEKSAEKLAAEIQNAKTLSTAQILAALNIPGIGLVIARKILLEHPLPELRNLSEESLSQIFGIGPERARILYNAFRDEAETLNDLLSSVNAVDVTAEEKPSVCFTGKMPQPRSWYENLARQNGYIPLNDVTASLSLLVTNDENAASSKQQKALKLGVKVLPLSEWLGGLPNPPRADDEPEFTQPDLF